MAGVAGGVTLIKFGKFGGYSNSESNDENQQWEKAVILLSLVSFDICKLSLDAFDFGFNLSQPHFNRCYLFLYGGITISFCFWLVALLLMIKSFNSCKSVSVTVAMC